MIECALVILGLDKRGIIRKMRDNEEKSEGEKRRKIMIIRLTRMQDIP